MEKLPSGQNYNFRSKLITVLSLHNPIAENGSDMSTPQLSLPFCPGKIGENWFNSYIKVP